MKKRLCIIIPALILVVALAVAGWGNEPTAPFKNKAEEEAAIAAAEQFDKEQEINIQQQKEFEMSLTSEERAELEAVAQQQEQQAYEEKKAAAEVRYAELEKQLAAFIAKHDMNNLSEQENQELIDIQDEMLDLYGPYIAPPYEQTDEEKLMQIINYDEELSVLLAMQEESLAKYRANGDDERAEMVMGHIRETQARLSFSRELRERYENGETAATLLQVADEWFREANEKTDW